MGGLKEIVLTYLTLGLSLGAAARIPSKTGTGLSGLLGIGSGRPRTLPISGGDLKLSKVQGYGHEVKDDTGDPENDGHDELYLWRSP